MRRVLHGTIFSTRRHLWRLAPAVLFIVYSLNCCGVFDYIAAIDFRDDNAPHGGFQWPPFVDVKQELAALLNGGVSTVPESNSFSKIRFSIEPSWLKIKQNLLVAIFVKSAAENYNRREGVRRSYSSKLYEGVRITFALGYPSSNNSEVEREARKYGDILQADFVDTYHNNTYKTISVLERLRRSAGLVSFEYVLIIDDDYWLNVPRLLKLINGFPSNGINPHTHDLYYGYIWDTMPFRSRFFKHYVPLSMYPYLTYPLYVAGGSMLLSNSAANKIALGARYLKYYPFDDLFVAFVARLLDILPTNDIRFWPHTVDNYDFTFLRDKIAAHGLSPEMLARAQRELVDAQRM